MYTEKENSTFDTKLIVKLIMQNSYTYMFFESYIISYVSDCKNDIDDMHQFSDFRDDSLITFHKGKVLKDQDA